MHVCARAHTHAHTHIPQKGGKTERGDTEDYTNKTLRATNCDLWQSGVYVIL
jgi:hypothetical protein